MNKMRAFLLTGVMIFVGFSAAAEPVALYELPVAFKNSDGQEVKLEQFKGKPVIITMTYSSCQYACPRILQRVKNLQNDAEKRKKSAHYIVVTFDPDRDTPERLAKVKKESDGTRNWNFLTGTDSAVRQLSMVLGIRFQKSPETGHISHDNKIVVLDENGFIKRELNGLNIDPADSGW